MNPGELSTACARWANRFYSSGPASGGTSIALIFTTAMGFRLPCGGSRPPRFRGGDDVLMSGDLLPDCGGRGRRLVMVHGLMGRGSTWRRSLPWLTELGRVYTYDRPWHRRRDVADPHPISTERFAGHVA